jgi:hypothetical protein
MAINKKENETATSGSSGPRKHERKVENDLCDNKFQL